MTTVVRVRTGRIGLAQRASRSRGIRAVLQGGFLAVTLGIYTLFTVFTPSRFLPSVASVLEAMLDLLASGTYWRAIGYTLGAAVLGLLISLLCGAALGALLSLRRSAFDSARFVIDFMRTIPPLALIPVGLLLIGPTLRMEVTLIVLAAVWPVVVQVYYAVRNVDPKLIEVGFSFRLSRIRRAIFIMAPAVGPEFATAVRLAATLSLLLSIGIELLASGQGLGYYVGFYQQADRIPETYATVFVIGLIGLGVNLGLAELEQHVLAWHVQREKA